MAAAFLWGLLAASSLVAGAVVALLAPVGRRPLGLVMALGAGVLLSAVAYELVEEAFETDRGGATVALGLAAGALTFYVGDRLLGRPGSRTARGRRVAAPAGGEESARAIVLGAALDGIPESFVIGAGLAAGAGPDVAVVAAVLLSNVPEALAASAGLRDAHRPGTILGIWTAVALVSALASAAGFVVADGTSPAALAFVLAYAGGAVLTMLADTMIPDAHELAGRTVGLVTTLGFALAFGLSQIQ